MSQLLRNIIRFVLLIALQIYVLDNIPPLHRFIIPVIYYLFILWLPFAIPRFWLLIIGFITGLSIDYFTMTPGLHAAACVLVAYIRPFLISILTPKDSSDFNYREPSAQGMGWAPYAVYVFVLTLLHHSYLVFLEWLQFGSFLDFIVKVIATTGISILLIFTAELLFPRRLKFRTNTA
ncbi:MAG: rod shape-determining protein MreD [Chitinophagaceae bacterium]|nr:MAG: rod shape-determining protein MreD [Chitinophagaceae bacterium]